MRPPELHTAAPRLASVDALRGITVAAMLLVNTPGDWGHVYAPLRHAHWHGCTLADLVFPTFLFVVGVSLALSLMPRREAGADLAHLSRAVLWRALRIVAIGLLLHVLAWWALDLPAFRPWGVLQRIGLCFALAGLAALTLSPRLQWLLCAALLLVSAAVLAWGGMAPGTNPFDRFDTALFAPGLYRYDAATGLGHDPKVWRARPERWRPRCSACAPVRGCARDVCARWASPDSSRWALAAWGRGGCRSTSRCGHRPMCCGRAASRCWGWRPCTCWSTGVAGRHSAGASV